MSLPRLPYTGGIAARGQAGFGGLDHSPGASDGALWNMENLTGDCFPLLAVRPRRHTAGALAAPNGLFAAGTLYYVDGAKLYADGEEKATLPAAGEKTLLAMGERLLIFPDKALWTENGGLVPLEARAARTGLVFGNGTYAGEDAAANSITTDGDAFPFRAGDAVSISGCAARPENNLTLIIREVSGDGKTLRFYENSFTLPEGETSVTEAGTVTLARNVPDMDFLCVNENRVWGCKGDAIFASKLGDPFNWNVFDGVATDAWSVESGSPGSFTACVSYLGYPVFFKEDRIFKVYGGKPSAFQLMSSAVLGVSPGSDKSLAVAGETLFYLSRAGVAAYNGGVPSVISGPFGAWRFQNAAGGSDGLKYYVSMRETGSGAWSLFVYDTLRRMWHREDGLHVLRMAWRDGLYALTAAGELVLLGTPPAVPEGAAEESAVEWSAEFADWTMGGFDGKYPVRLRMRFEGDAGAYVAVKLQYDSGGDWETAAEETPGTKRSVYLALPIRRCDHFRLKLEGTGAVRLYALSWEYYDGTYPRK